MVNVIRGGFNVRGEMGGMETRAPSPPPDLDGYTLICLIGT